MYWYTLLLNILNIWKYYDQKSDIVNLFAYKNSMYRYEVNFEKYMNNSWNLKIFE